MRNRNKIITLILITGIIYLSTMILLVYLHSNWLQMFLIGFAVLLLPTVIAQGVSILIGRKKQKKKEVIEVNENAQNILSEIESLREKYKNSDI